MKLKKILNVTTGMLLFSSTIFVNCVQAQDYITQSQINTANGVAGLNAKGEVTANVSNKGVYTPFLMINNDTGSIRFTTGDSNPNNSDINLSYNKAAQKDPWGNLLDADTFYFTNHHDGNNYKFIGSISASQSVSAPSILVNGKSVESAVDKANNAFPRTYQVKNSYSALNEDPLIVMNDSNTFFDKAYTRTNTLEIGGQTANSGVRIKATCQNTSGGDLGGACFQFNDLSGPQGWHRSGNGGADGTNLEIQSGSNSPLDSIGGNKLVKDGDGDHDYKVEGNDYPVTSDTPAGSTTITIKGTFGCGVGMSSKSNCKMTGISFLDPNGKVVVDSEGTPITSFTVTPGVYNPKEDTTTINFPKPDADKFPNLDASKLVYSLANDLKAGDNVKITYYSADGQAYAIRPLRSNLEIYPALSSEEANLIQARMALWTNIANGMNSIEDTNSESAATDMPNYYYGYNAGITRVKQSENANYTYSVINIESYYYPGAEGRQFLWKTLNIDNQAYGTEGVPGQNNGDSLDYKLTYTEPGTTNIKYNSNYHRYSQPTLFLGLNNKNFNMYALQNREINTSDSITREFDNTWDFWLRSDHDYQISSHGLTMAWAPPEKGVSKRYTASSYMLRMAGFNMMPTGARIDGVWENGGKLIDTDGGFSVKKWAVYEPKLNTLNGEQVVTALGSAKTAGPSYQLFSYMSNDGSLNNSWHFGITKSLENLQYNYSPTCKNNGKCSVLGQIIFDPLGYVGGLALGSGQGENTKLGLIVDKDSNVIIKNKLTVNGKSVNDVVDNAVVKSQINAVNGIAGLNARGEVTANVSNNMVYTPFLMINNSTGSIRFMTGDSNPDNADINFAYNKDVTTDSWGNQLDANTFYFTNHHGGNNYKFIGNVDATKTVSASKFKGELSTPSSSSETCVAGEFKDDINYHYVCVSTNKWKRVALSDF